MSDPAPTVISGLCEIASRYEALLVDVWGVIHNGRNGFEPAMEACRRFRAERGPVALISNSPRPANGVIAQFADLGMPGDFFDAVATSGDATRLVLESRAPGPAFKLGPPKDEPIYDGLGLAFAPLEAAAFVSCTGLFDDETETPDDYAELLAAMRARDLEMVCANPDVIVQRGDKMIYCAGALAQAYAARGGRVVYAGKPHAAIYELAFAALDQAADRALARSSVLAVGDGPETDLDGAARQGLDALFIARGIHAAEMIEEGGLNPARVRGVRAAYAAVELRW